MERPRWAPVVLSGALPRELPDLIAMTCLATITSQIAVGSFPLTWSSTGLWSLFLVVPLICLLAAMSNSTNKEREELALVAYGSSTRQIEIGYAFRGCVIVIVGSIPLVVRLATSNFTALTDLISLMAMTAIGSVVYTLPSLRRTHSLNFVEQYKG